MKTIYKGDSRYEKIYEQMQLLGIQDVSSPTQVKNGTIVWRLPILSRKRNTYLEYASFASGYVRNQGVDCHSNWQCNRRIEGEPQYFDSGKTLQNGKPLYTKWSTRACELIPIEIDRLEYMMKYVIKNEFIKRANYVQEGKFVPKWQYDNVRKAVIEHGIDQYVAPEKPNEDLLCAMEAQTEGHNVKEVTVIIDGSKFKLI